MSEPEIGLVTSTAVVLGFAAVPLHAEVGRIHGKKNCRPSMRRHQHCCLRRDDGDRDTCYSTSPSLDSWSILRSKVCSATIQSVDANY